MTELLKAEDTAARLGVTVGTLAVWRRSQRYALRYVKVGRKVRYRSEDIEEFIRARTMPGDGEPSKSRRSRSRRGRAA